MIVDDYEKWADSLILFSQKYYSRYESYKEDDVDDWEGIAWALFLDEYSEHPCGVSFEGALGTGKHTALSSFLYVLKQSDYGVIYSLGVDHLPDSHEECGIFEKYINSLCCKSVEEGQKVIFIVDDIERSAFSEFIMDVLTDLIVKYGKDEYNELRMFYIIISNDVLTAPSWFSRMTYSFRFSNTDVEQRKKYIQKCASHLIGKIDVDLFAELIGDCTYFELTNIVRFLSLSFAAAHKGLSDEENLIRVIKRYIKKNNNLPSERLPDYSILFEKLLESRSVVDINVENKRNSYSNPEDGINQLSVLASGESVYKDGKRKEFDEMPPRDLCVDIFGEEFIRMNQERVNSQTS